MFVRLGRVAVTSKKAPIGTLVPTGYAGPN